MYVSTSQDEQLFISLVDVMGIQMHGEGWIVLVDRSTCFLAVKINLLVIPLPILRSYYAMCEYQKYPELAFSVQKG